MWSAFVRRHSHKCCSWVIQRSMCAPYLSTSGRSLFSRVQASLNRPTPVRWCGHELSRCWVPTTQPILLVSNASMALVRGSGVDHMSVYFGLCGRKFVLCLFAECPGLSVRNVCHKRTALHDSSFYLLVLVILREAVVLPHVHGVCSRLHFLSVHCSR